MILFLATAYCVLPTVSRLDGVKLGHELEVPHVPADLALDLIADRGVLAQELFGVLAPLAQPCLAEGEEGAALFDQAHLHAHVDDAAFFTDAVVVHQIELGGAERGGDLVLDHLDLVAPADHFGPLLDLVDAAQVEAYAGVELEGPAAGRGLGVAEHHANLLTQLVDEDNDRIGAADARRELAQRLRHQAGLQADVAVAHIPFRL